MEESNIHWIREKESNWLCA